VHEFQAHWTVVPTVTVFVAGEKALLVTEIPWGRTGVLPGVWLAGPEEEPPPHAAPEINASAINTFLVIMLLPARVSSHGTSVHESDQAAFPPTTAND